MPPKKPAKPNGFFLFAQELKSRQGRKFNSMKEACDAAAPLWARMDKAQRKPYDDMAKAEKGHMKATRYTSEGLDVEVLTRQEQEQQRIAEQMKSDIFQSIEMASNQGRLADETFFLIHVNIFCYCQPDDTYFPAELAVTAFSLREGIKPQNVLHFLVHPGHLPMGYKFEAKQHSDETHQIEIPLEGRPVRDNTEEVFNHLVQFMTKRAGGSKKLPILYADEKYQKMTQQILNKWGIEFSDDGNLFRVYNLQLMFRYLKNMVAAEEVWPSDTFSTRELEKDIYAYTTDCACDFHKLSPVPVYCSKSIVVRYAYIVCDNCCSDLGIELIPGQHVPPESAIPDLSSRPSSVAASFVSRSSHISKSTKNTGRTRRDYTDEDTDDVFNSDTWETESVLSTTSNDSSVVSINDAANSFPLLMSSRGRMESSNSYSDSSSIISKTSGRSYAGVSGLPQSNTNKGSSSASIPAPFERMENLSLNSSQFPAIGRGMNRPVGVNPSSAESDSDFPVLGKVGKGRGFAPPSRGRGLRKPNIAD